MEELDCDADLVDLVYMYLSTKSYPNSENKKNNMEKNASVLELTKAESCNTKRSARLGAERYRPASRYNYKL